VRRVRGQLRIHALRQETLHELEDWICANSAAVADDRPASTIDLREHQSELAPECPNWLRA